MARIAREQQRYDVFGELIDKLLAIAPNDEAVQELAASRDEILARASEVEEVHEDSEVEDLGDSAVIEEVIPDAAVSAEPLLLRNDDDATALDSAQYDVIDGAPEISTIGEEIVAGAPGQDDPRVLQLISEAQSYRRVRLYDRAVRALISALEIDGRSIPARAELRDVYLEAGEQGEALVEMLNIASLQLDALDGDGAAQTLQDVLALDPTNERAAQMLRELGYEPVTEGEEQQQQPLSSTHVDFEPPQMSRARMPSYDPEAPLPSYDLDEPSTAEQQAPPLPSFQLDDAEAPPPPIESAASFELLSPVPAGGLGKSAEAPTSSYAKPTNEEIEEALEEADFFASRGLFEDAKTVLNEQLNRAPNHKLLIERLREIDEQEVSAQRGSGTRARPQSAAPASSMAPDDFDIAASLEALDSLEVAPEAQQLMNETGQVDVEEVFAKFKEGVQKTLSADDGKAHYDLGQAYKEMGLADDAINEFETAARDPKLEVEARFLVGMIETERGRLKEAVAAYQKALTAKLRTPEQETILCFEIGAAYESMRMNKDALSYYQRVVRRDPNHRDVQERVRRLSRPDTKAPIRQVAVGADDEFDRAFDELLGDGKLGGK